MLAIGTFFSTGYWPLYSSCMFCQICKLQGPLFRFCCGRLAVFSRGCFGSIKIWKLLHNRIKHVNFRNDYSQIFGKLHAYRYFCFWMGVYCPRQHVVYLLLAAWVCRPGTVSSSDREFPQVHPPGDFVPQTQLGHKLAHVPNWTSNSRFTTPWTLPMASTQSGSRENCAKL